MGAAPAMRRHLFDGFFLCGLEAAGPEQKVKSQLLAPSEFIPRLLLLCMLLPERVWHLPSQMHQCDSCLARFLLCGTSAQDITEQSCWESRGADQVAQFRTKL